MTSSPLRLQKTAVASLCLHDLQKYFEGWLLSCEINQHSAATLANRRLTLKNLLWFLAYLNTRHKGTGGRWGNPQQINPVKPRTVKD